MKLNEISILLITAANFEEYLHSKDVDKEEHWQYRWHHKMPNSELIEAPALKDNENITANHAFLEWVSAIKQNIEKATSPIVLVCHSYGVYAALVAIHDLIPTIMKRIKGAFFVAPALYGNKENIANVSLAKLPFPSFLIASANDNLLDTNEAKILAATIGSFFIDGGENGHIDSDTGHGPWPEGLLLLAQLLSKL